jgi:hypothetical protein
LVRDVGLFGGRAWFAVPALTVAMLCGSCAQPMGGSAKYFNSYMNQAPPELAAAGAWINSPETLSLAALRGRVVWLEFSFLH